MSNTTDKMYDRYVYLHINPRFDSKHQGVAVHIKLDDEGVVVDAWQKDEVIATTYKLYNEMGVEVKGIEDADIS